MVVYSVVRGNRTRGHRAEPTLYILWQGYQGPAKYGHVIRAFKTQKIDRKGLNPANPTLTMFFPHQRGIDAGLRLTPV